MALSHFRQRGHQMPKTDLQKNTLRCAVSGLFAVIAATGAIAQPKASDPFVTIDAPGAGTQLGQGTFPTAISSNNIITGNYIDSSGVSHGFFGPAGGTITTFDAPNAGAYGTSPTSINAAGTIT